MTEDLPEKIEFVNLNKSSWYMFDMKKLKHVELNTFWEISN